MATFLIRNLDEGLRERLEADAREQGEPLAETIRMILCAHYDLDCPETKGWPRKEAWGKATTIRLVMPPQLFDALKSDASRSGDSMQSLVHAALEGHYAVT